MQDGRDKRPSASSVGMGRGYATPRSLGRRSPGCGGGNRLESGRSHSVRREHNFRCAAILDFHCRYIHRTSTGDGMLTATIVALVFAIHAFYLSAKVGRMPLIRCSGNWPLRVELRRSVYMEQPLLTCHRFPSPGKRVCGDSALRAVCFGARQAALHCQTKPAPTLVTCRCRGMTSSFHAGRVPVPLAEVVRSPRETREALERKRSPANETPFPFRSTADADAVLPASRGVRAALWRGISRMGVSAERVRAAYRRGDNPAARCRVARK